MARHDGTDWIGYAVLRNRALTRLTDAASEAIPTSYIPITSANRPIMYSI